MTQFTILVLSSMFKYFPVNSCLIEGAGFLKASLLQNKLVELVTSRTYHLQFSLPAMSLIRYVGVKGGWGRGEQCGVEIGTTAIEQQ